MDDIKPLHFFSYSRAEADSTCPRKRYYGSEWGRTGLSPIESGWELRYGNLIHKHLDLLAKVGRIDYEQVRGDVFEMAPVAIDTYTALAIGQLRGFVRSIWPALMKHYDIIESEQLRSWEPEAGFLFRFRQDLLLKDKETGEVCYVDYKTTSSDSPQWLQSWNKSPQLHSSMYALRQSGVHVDCAMVIGLYKGYTDRKTNLPSSIFVKGWANREYVMTPGYSYTYTRAKGWEAFNTWDEFNEDMMVGWVYGMPEDVVKAQFPITNKIALREDIAEVYFRQQMYREKAVEAGLAALESGLNPDGVLDVFFPQDFNKCEPAWGFKCEFVPICWIPWIGADPLGSGQFVRREPVFEDGAKE